MQAVNFFVRRHMNKQIGKAVILQCDTLQAYQKQADQLFQQQKRIRQPETFFYHPRNLARHYIGKQRRQRRKDITRNFDQKRINFFVHNVLASKKISIPLR